MKPWPDHIIPPVCWDRPWTAGEIRERLRTASGVERHRLMAWLMRELKTTEVWQFMQPVEILREFDDIKRWLGPAKGLWEYLFRTWHELGIL